MCMLTRARGMGEQGWGADMGEKLNLGDAFPSVTLDIVGGGTLTVPGDVDSKYTVVLFYRGHW